MGIFRTILIAPAALLCSACAGPLNDGICDYAHARYPEALDRLRSAEHVAMRWSQRDRARYALYRGLTHLALGDHHATVRWLEEAKRALYSDSSIFSDSERNRLASALAHLPP